jgi:hypothetical protein
VDGLIEGGCLCGGVRYSASSEPALVGVCHCDDCRKFSGSAFSFLVAIEKSSLEVRGTLKTYSNIADTGRPIFRSFCPDCGSSVVEESASHPGYIIVNAGTLDFPACVSPSIELYCHNALPWIQISGMKRFAKMPPSFRSE